MKSGLENRVKTLNITNLEVMFNKLIMRRILEEDSIDLKKKRPINYPLNYS